MRNNILEALPHSICPVCHDPVDCEVYENRERDTVGCDACVTRQYAGDIKAFYNPNDPGESFICPVCGGDCEEAFTDRDGEVLGCNCCITRRDAWSKQQCFPK